MTAPRHTDAEDASPAELRRQLHAAQCRIAELERLVHLDPLTGVLNRRGLDFALKSISAETARTPEQTAVLYLDLDGFKALNDGRSHEAGDLALQVLAQALAENCRPCDVVARVGGDEFVVVLRKCTHRQARNLATRMTEKIRDLRVPFPGQECMVLSVSIGVAGTGQGDFVHSLRRAERDMYRCKRARSAASKASSHRRHPGPQPHASAA